MSDHDPEGDDDFLHRSPVPSDTVPSTLYDGERHRADRCERAMRDALEREKNALAELAAAREDWLLIQTFVAGCIGNGLPHNEERIQAEMQRMEQARKKQ